MDIEELMNKVHLLEIRAKRLSWESFCGEYETSFKGQGLDFEDFREYQHGDEIRFIDWNVTAKTRTPHVRTFREEREMSVLIAVDVSGSSAYTSGDQMKRELAAEIAAVLAFSARQNGDKVGLLLFTDETEFYLPPKKGSKHVLRLIREILAYEPKREGTSIGNACDWINQTMKRKGLVFVISDFMDYDFEKSLGVMAQRLETVCIRIEDQAERRLPKVGKVLLKDAETGHEVIVNTKNANVRMGYKKMRRRRLEGLEKTFLKYKIPHTTVFTGEDYLPCLHRLFEDAGRR